MKKGYEVCLVEVDITDKQVKASRVIQSLTKIYHNKQDAIFEFMQTSMKLNEQANGDTEKLDIGTKVKARLPGFKTHINGTITEYVDVYITESALVPGTVLYSDSIKESEPPSDEMLKSGKTVIIKGQPIIEFDDGSTKYGCEISWDIEE